MRRAVYEEFCINFLNRDSSLPECYGDELERLALHIKTENIDQSLDCIFKELFSDGANLGRLVVALGFIKSLCNRFAWCDMDKLVTILLDILESVSSDSFLLSNV